MMESSSFYLKADNTYTYERSSFMLILNSSNLDSFFKRKNTFSTLRKIKN